MNNDLEQNISNKQDAIRSDAFLAKKNFDTEKDAFDSYDPTDYSDESMNLDELRHELKLMISMMHESKFDEVIHLISNPSRLMGLNFVIGFMRGLGFTLAVLLMIIAILFSLSDTSLLNSLVYK